MMAGSSPNQILARAERTIKDACEGVDVIFILRVGDQMSYRHSLPAREAINPILTDAHVSNLLSAIFLPKPTPALFPEDAPDASP